MNVKLIRFAFGQEVVAELLEETDTTIKIKNSLAAFPTQQGTVGFIAFIPLVDRGKDEVVIDKQHVLYIIDPSEDVCKQHKTAFSPVITPEKSLIL